MSAINIQTVISPSVDELNIYAGILIYNKENKFRGFINYSSKTDFNPTRTYINKYYLCLQDKSYAAEYNSLEKLLLDNHKLYNFIQL